MSLLTKASLVMTPNAIKSNKVYSIIPSNGNGDLTFTRNTAATQINSSGNVENVLTTIPRLNYDTVGGCPSLLLEPQRINLNLYSNNLENAYWTLYQATRTINSAVSPDGTTNAIKLTENSTIDFHGIYLVTSTNVTSGQTYSRSVYLKQAGRTWASLIINDSAITYRAWFDLQNGVLGTVGVGITAQITNVGNGWYRCTITRTAVATTFASLAIEIAISNGLSSYLGDGTSGIYVYGAQLEAGNYPTSYIPTTTIPLTRNADQLTRSNIYTNGLITSAGGTWFIDQSSNQFTGGGGLEYSISLTAVAQNSLVIGINSNNTLNFYKFTSSVQTTAVGISGSNVARTKVVVRWNASTGVITIFFNGTLVNTFTSQTFVNYETLALTDVNAGSTQGGHKVNSSMLFPTPLSDSECIALTTL